jgi:outer membrane protein W
MHTHNRVLRPLAAALIAAALVVPAFAQTSGGAMVGTGPGTATAARLVTSSATVSAIDMATRKVTLRRADGTTFSVVAGPEVRNLAQLRVGDTVSLDYYDTLTLELKKGGTGAPASRTDVVGAGRAELGARPAGAATRETVIVADVVAVDAAGQNVSLRGPQGNILVLPVKDPEQFRRIAVGDQVQATYVEAVAVAVTPAVAPAPVPPPAPVAAAWGRWMAGARVLNISPNVSSSVSGFDVQNQWTGEIDGTYFFTPNVAVEGSMTWAKQDVSFNGQNVGSVKMMPVVFALQYHWNDLATYGSTWAAFKPYVGGGFNYTYFYKNELGNNVGATVNSGSWGGALQAGFDWQFQRNWYVNFDAKYLWINNDVRLNSVGNVNAGNLSSSLDFNPWLFGIGIRYRF